MAENKIAADLDRERWLILQRRLAEHRIAEIFRVFRRERIEPILIKGWAAGLKYPKPFERYFSDIDVAVSPRLYEKSLLVAAENNLSIDLHRGLRHHDTLSWENVFENSKTVVLDDVEVRLLREEDHLRVLCVHWLNDGGAFKEKLLDIYFAIKNRSKDFDWDRCLEVVSARRKKWIIYTIGLAHKYYQLDIDDLPFAGAARRVPEWLIEALEKEWQSGLRLLPLESCLSDRAMLWRQIKKRFPPNPIESVIEMEGDFDTRFRFHYQLGSIGMRLLPSVRRLYATFRRNGG